MVKWEPPVERICRVVQYRISYREVILQAEKDHWNSITVSRNTTSYTVDLACWKQYEITVSSFYSYGGNDKVDSNIWNFKTGTKGKGWCLTQVSVTTRSTYGTSTLSWMAYFCYSVVWKKITNINILSYLKDVWNHFFFFWFMDTDRPGPESLK